MKNENFTEQELAVKMTETIIAGARKIRKVEAKEEELFELPSMLREALRLHLSGFEYQAFDDDSPEVISAGFIASAIATIEDISQMERQSGQLYNDIEVQIGALWALKEILAACNGKIDASSMYLLLDDLHVKALDNIYGILKDYVVIPKSKNRCEVIS